MRIAWASPVPPARSGIADYSAELLPHVARLADADVYFEGADTVEAALSDRFRCRPVSELASRPGGYDVVVYQIGNHETHDLTRRAALAVPGVAMLHEVVLHSLVRETTLVRGDLAAYQEELRYCAGETGRRAAAAVAVDRRKLDPWRFPLFERLVDRSLAIVVHSEFARARVLESRPLARVAVVPHFADVESLRPPSRDERLRARHELGLPEDAIVFGSFGLMTKEKHIDPALAAFAELRRVRPEARLVLVGEVTRGYDLAAAIRASGAEGVTVTGRVPLDDMHRWMTAVDVAIALRFPTGGESSGALMRLFALGVPAIVSRVGSYAELPPGSCFPVDVDEAEPRTLAALFETLALDPRLRAAAGREARRCAVERHALPIVARALVDRCREAVERGGPPRQSVPPLESWRPPDLPVALLQSLGSASADLGVGEDDEVLDRIAAAYVEVGFDRTRAT
jgi:glycosyltransferase involved in cell wall biosynthesis